jgi:hypothetical protein
MSAPAMKALPFPVNTTPFTESSDSAFVMDSYNPVLTPSLNGLTGGLSTFQSNSPNKFSKKSIIHKKRTFYFINSIDN